LPRIVAQTQPVFFRTAQNAMGGPSFKHYSQNPVFELDVQAPTELKYVLSPLPFRSFHPLPLLLTASAEYDSSSSAPRRPPR